MSIIIHHCQPSYYITGQTRVEFQEQKEQKAEEDDQGNDKDKNIKPKNIVDNDSQQKYTKFIDNDFHYRI